MGKYRIRKSCGDDDVMITERLLGSDIPLTKMECKLFNAMYDDSMDWASNRRKYAVEKPRDANYMQRLLERIRKDAVTIPVGKELEIVELVAIREANFKGKDVLEARTKCAKLAMALSIYALTEIFGWSENAIQHRYGRRMWAYEEALGKARVVIPHYVRKNSNLTVKSFLYQLSVALARHDDWYERGQTAMVNSKN